MPEAVELVSYDPAWPRLFEREAARLRAVLEGAVVEHVGSTSVPGLAAKPFIDMVAIIEDEGELPAAVSALQSLSYRYVPEAEAVVPERRFFRRLDESPGYHAHVVARSARLWSNLLSFRDELRSKPAVANAYLEMKLRLAQSHSQDVDAYTTAKGPFVEGVLRKRREAGAG